MFSLLQFQTTSSIPSDIQNRLFLLVPMFYTTEDWTCPPHLNLFSLGIPGAKYSFRSHILLGTTRQNCWPNIQVSPHYIYWKNILYIYTLTIDKHNFITEHHILVLLNLNYRCRIFWAQCYFFNKKRRT